MRWHEWHVCEVYAGFTYSTGIPASVALSSMRPLESGERPRVKPTVHVLPVVETLTDVRQVLHHQHRIFKLLGVLDGFPRRFLHDVGEGVLVVVEPFVGTPPEASRSCSRFRVVCISFRRCFALLPLHTNGSVGEPSLRAQPVMRAVSPMSADVRGVTVRRWFFNRVLDGDV